MPDDLTWGNLPLTARAGLIAADYRNGHRHSVRTSITVGETQQSAVLLALAVLDNLLGEACEYAERRIMEDFSDCIRGE